jgi:Icc-related predicted phosphoesterase
MPLPAEGATLLVSDIHSHYHVIDAQISHATETLGRTVHQVLVLGDFGLFGPNLHDFFRRDGRRFSLPVSFIEGNHEDFCTFDDLVRDYADVVTHIPRNSVRRIGAERWLCIGGAQYMDSWSTPSGCEINEQDIIRCLDNPPGSIDIVISHDCPTGIGVTSAAELGHLGSPGVAGLARIAAHLEPRLWFFGHHHRWHEIETGPTRYVGLPQSWEGYALLDEEGKVDLVESRIDLPRRPAWWKWIGLK